jgi:hypothetical protein
VPLGPVVLVGKMVGKFADPPSCPDKVGKHDWDWKAEL